MSLAGASIGTLQQGATIAGNGTFLEVGGDAASQAVEVWETGGGTGTLNFEGSFDGTFTRVYPVGYQRVDNQAAPARAVAALAVTANMAAVFQILDPYPYIRARLSAPAGGVNVNARMFAVSGV